MYKHNLVLLFFYSMKKKRPLFSMPSDTKTYVYVLALLAVIILLLYGNTINHGYAIDDDLVTQDHLLVQKGLKGLPEIFTSYYFADTKMQFGYRPMVMASFAVEYAFFGQNPGVGHFINILLYIINCFLIFVLLRKIFPRTNLQFLLLTTLLFVVHPIHTEVVCSLKSRDELLSFVLGCLAFLCTFKYAENPKWYWLPLILICFVGAIFSKQTAYSLFFIMPLGIYFSGIKLTKKAYLPLILVFLTSIIAASTPRFLLPPLEREIFFFENPLVASISLIDRFTTAFYVLYFYIKKLIYPHPLVFYYGYNMLPMKGITSPLVFISFGVSVFLGFYALWKFKKKDVLSFAILYFFFTIGIFLNIIGPVAGIVAERFAYYASLGFCLALSVGIFKILSVKTEGVFPVKKIKMYVFLSLLVLIPYAVKTKVRTYDWKDHKTLYSQDIKHLENSALGNAIFAEWQINEIYNNYMIGKPTVDIEQKLGLAVKHYKRAIEIYDGYVSSYSNLAFIYYQFFNRYHDAIPLLEKAVTLKPDYAEAHYNLAYCHHMLFHLEEAKVNYETTIALDSQFLGAYSYLGEVYAMLEKWDEAVKINEALKVRLPDNDIPYINLGKIFLMQGDTVKSMYHFEQAALIAPENYGLIKELANYFQQTNDLEKASYYFGILNQQAPN